LQAQSPEFKPQFHQKKKKKKSLKTLVYTKKKIIIPLSPAGLELSLPVLENSSSY
jgi:hypothetical protein